MSRSDRGGRPSGRGGGPSGRPQDSGAMLDDRGADRRARGQDSRNGAGRAMQNIHNDGGYLSVSSPSGGSEGMTRQEGFVVTLRDAYAFVQSADSERQYFFHYSEIRGGGSSRDLRNGTELMFDIFEPRNGDKPTAINVTILPRGTIKMEVDIAVDLHGTIHKEPKERRDERGPDRRDKKDILLMTGRIKTSPGQSGLGGEPAPDSAIFGIEDTVNLEDGSPYKPRTEDEVLFDMVLVRATRQRRAVRVRLVKAKVDPRETGIVSALKDSFGFIQCCDREERLFFHCSEMADRRGALREGDEVDFIVEKDRDGRNVGRAIRVLPAGTVSFDKILGEDVAGTVERELRASKKGGRSGGPPLRDDMRGAGRELFGGLVACELEGQQLRLPFEGEDIQLPAGSRGEEPPLILKGDGVSVKVLLHKPSGRKRATAVRVVKFGKEGREQGVVTRSKEGTGQGQIRCCDRQEPLPFNIADLDTDPAAAAAAAAVGTEVEFNVVESRGDGRPMAVRLERLSPGTVSFETVIDGPFRGTVVNCVPSGAGASPRQPQAKKKAVREGPAGLIAIDAAHVLEAAGSSQSHNGDSGGRGDAARGELPFGWGDQSERAAVLRKGDVVSFAVVVDRPSKTRRAARVALVAPASAAGGEAEVASEVGPVQGVVVSVKGGGGFVRCCDRDARVHFSMADLDPASIPARPPRGGPAAAPGGHPVAAVGAAEGEAVREEEAARGGAGGHDEEEEHEEGHSDDDGGDGDAAHDAAHPAGGRRKKSGKKAAAHVGDEVEFYIYSDPAARVVKAVKLRVLPPGTVVLQTVAAEKQRGVVDREPGAGKGGAAGLIRHTDADGAAALLPFAPADVEAPPAAAGGKAGAGAAGVGKGDAVEFSVMADRATGERWAARVVALPHEGVVDSVKDTYGYIRPDRTDEGGGGGVKLVVFYLTEVERGDQGKIDKGDTVQYWMQAGSRGKEPTATRVKRVFRMKESPGQMPDALRRAHPHSAKAMSRTAAGPDGTRGFRPGRGRALPPPTPPPPAASRPSFDTLASVAPVFTPGQPVWSPAAAQFNNAAE